jgi:hypothetical protein
MWISAIFDTIRATAVFGSGAAADRSPIAKNAI